MVKDAVFELNFEMAKLLVGKGYGQLIDWYDEHCFKYWFCR
jgi:hypothetical protein